MIQYFLLILIIFLKLEHHIIININPFPHTDAFWHLCRTAADDFWKHCGKRRNCSSWAISHFATMAMFSILFNNYTFIYGEFLCFRFVVCGKGLICCITVSNWNMSLCATNNKHAHVLNTVCVELIVKVWPSGSLSPMPPEFQGSLGVVILITASWTLSFLFFYCYYRCHHFYRKKIIETVYLTLWWFYDRLLR